jgi:hypothetical protein
MRLSRKLISFELDPSLERLWRLIGFTIDEQREETDKLESALCDTYANFISQASSQAETYRHELQSARTAFDNLKTVYGDTQFTISNAPRTSLRGSIAAVETAIQSLKTAYQERTIEFERVFERLGQLFSRLGPTDNPTFLELGSEDFSQTRLNLCYERLELLEAECSQRENYFTSLRARLSGLSEELGIEIPKQIESIFKNGLLTTESLNLVTAQLDQLEAEKENRLTRVTFLEKETKDLYELLAVDASDQLGFTHSLTSESISELEGECEFLIEEKDSRLPLVLKELTKAIQSLCDFMQLPHRERPHYRGSDHEEGVVFLRGEFEKLQLRQEAERPMIDLISEIERQRENLTFSATDAMSTGSGASRSVAGAERVRRKAREMIPQLEQKLFVLLLKYRKENGRDFVFGGVKYIEQFDLSNPPAPPRVESPGRQLLMEKIHESMCSSAGSQSAASSRTPPKRRYLS